MRDKHQIIEEPDEVKVSCPVLKTSGSREGLTEFNLLEKWGRKCAYCHKEGLPLEVEHIQPRSKGGSNRVSNLTIACTKCNQRKGNKAVEQPRRSVRTHPRRN
ncbi:MAG: HNH endonuclease [Symploca sp. SIO3C6]|nr:HNH endonuclease [Symploca sp. SIO3C6]